MLFKLLFHTGDITFETEEQEATIKGIQPLFANGN